MVIINYINTNLIINYLIKIELTLERINSYPIPKSYIRELQEDIFSEDIHALSEIINYPIGLDEARKVVQGKILPSYRAKYLVFMNYRNTLEFAKNYDRIHFMQPSNELMIHINSITSNKIGDDWKTTSLRAFSEKPNPTFDTWLKLRDYYPAVIFEEHFEELLNMFFTSNNSQIHEYIKLAILTYELIDKAPFVITNQITSIALLSTLANDMKKNPNTTVSFSKIFNFIKNDLENAYKLSKQHRDSTSFIEAFLYSASVNLIELEYIYKDIFENRVKKHSALSDKLNKRQIKTLDHLEISKKITREELSKMMGVSFMTSYRDLQDLVKKNFLEQKGIGRATFYILKNSNTESKIDNEKLEVFGKLE